MPCVYTRSQFSALRLPVLRAREARKQRSDVDYDHIESMDVQRLGSIAVEYGRNGCRGV